MRALYAPFAILLLAAPLTAQAAKGRGSADPDQKITSTGALPQGWRARVDRDQPADRVKFVAMGKGYHATMGPAATFFNPQWRKKGDYKVAASFTQTKAPAHPEAYGILIGGTKLRAADQAYTYFLVRGTGEYYVANRKGAEVTKLVNWTAHPAVKKQDASGKQTNVLGVEVKGNEVIFLVNGTEVTRRPKSELLTEGVFGYRINHNLDVHIEPVE